METLKKIAYTFVLIGAVNWGLVGIFNFDLVAFFLGNMTIWSRLIYALVGISAVYAALTMRECICDGKIV